MQQLEEIKVILVCVTLFFPCFYCNLTEFEPLFALITKSRYAEKYIFKEGLTQMSALRDHMRNDPEVRDAMDMIKEGGYEKGCALNPCSYEFVFHGLRKGINV